MTDRQMVREAFAELRRQGYTAKMNFSCCSSCAWYELSEAGKADKAVFFNRQSNDAFDGPTLVRDLYLQWDGDHKVIAKALRAQFGKRVVAPKDTATCFRIKAVAR